MQREGFSGATFSVVPETASRPGIEAWLVRRCSLSGNRMRKLASESGT